MGQVVEIFEREIPIEAVNSVELVRGQFEKQLTVDKIRTSIASLVGIGALVLMVIDGFNWIALIVMIIGLANIPFAFKAWAAPHTTKWQVRVKYSHLEKIEALDSPEMWYLDKEAALKEANKVFVALKKAGAGDVHRIDFERRMS